MLYDAILFDMDGTLVASLSFHIQSFQRFLSQQRLALAPCQVRPLMGMGIQDIFAHFLPDIPADGAFLLLRQFYASQVQDLLDGLSAIPGAAAVLGQLRAQGIPLGLVTNTEHDLANRMLAATGLDLFDEVCGGTDRGAPKAERCRLVLGAFSVTADRALYVGDSRGDAAMAAQEGMDCCLIDNAYAWEGNHVAAKGKIQTYVLHDIIEIISILEGEPHHEGRIGSY